MLHGFAVGLGVVGGVFAVVILVAIIFAAFIYSLKNWN